VNAVPFSDEQASPRHASPAAFAAFFAANPRSEYRRRQLAARRRFAERYPDLADWFAAPLECRVGRLGGPDPIVTDVRSYEARPYLMFLGITGHARLDWPWLLAVGQLTVQELAAHTGVDVGIDTLVAHAVRSATALTQPGWSSAGWSAASSCTAAVRPRPASQPPISTS
jgi:hypothetical protein